MPGNVLLLAFCLSGGGSFSESMCQGSSVPLPLAYLTISGVLLELLHHRFASYSSLWSIIAT